MISVAEKTQSAGRMVEQCEQALQDMRRSLIELFASIDADPTQPQDVSRKIGINRILAWKLSRVIGAAHPFASLNHLPGPQGIELAAKAFQKAGAPAPAVEHVTTTLRKFLDVVSLHAGDRDQFELTLESMGLFERENRLESGRELAYRGNSMIWGVQARTRAAIVFAAPTSPGASTINIVQLGGLVGFRRLRPNATWRLFRMQLHDDQGRDINKVIGPESFEPPPPNGPPLLVREFCSPNMPELLTARSGDGLEYVLPGGEIGNLAAFDCFVAYIVRGLPMYATPEHQYGSFGSPITLPVETLVFDLIVHRDVQMAARPEMQVYGFPHGGLDSPQAQTVQNLLPINREPIELPGSPPAVSTPLVPRYSQIASRVYERMNWNPAEFGGMRVQLPFPPMSSRVILRWKLPESA